MEAAMARRKTDVIQFKVRMLEELRKRLEMSAKAENRSLNAEIGARLQHSYADHRDARDHFLSDQLTEISEKLSDLAQKWANLAAQKADEGAGRLDQPDQKPEPQTQPASKPDHAEQFWARHPQPSQEEIQQLMSEEFNKRAEEEFERGNTKLADWLRQQARESAGGSAGGGNPRRRARSAAPDQEPELPMPRRESSK
jgi:hypothetical protein